MIRRASDRRYSWAALWFLLIVPACSHETPVAPSPAHSITPSATSPAFEAYSRALSGRVFDENGLPVPNATVVAFGTEGNSCCAKPTPPVRTDANGEYKTVTTAFKPPFHYFGTEVA